MTIPIWYLLLPMAIGALIGAAIVWLVVRNAAVPPWR